MKGQQVRGKVFNITSRQGNTNPNHHLTPVRMAISNKSTSHKCWRGRGEQRTLAHCWWECRLVQPLWQTVQRFLKNWKCNYHVIQPSLFLVFVPPTMKLISCIWYLHPHIYCSIIYNSQDKETTQVPFDGWMDTENVIYMHICIYINNI